MKTNCAAESQGTVRAAGGLLLVLLCAAPACSTETPTYISLSDVGERVESRSDRLVTRYDDQYPAVDPERERRPDVLALGQVHPEQ